ncbi:hypothetical protein AB0L99_37660 [Streptomyces sp. NPDC051954]|uniref:hypothetical protein n=1 Tax=unclassified Streptomyces TaxID=2593676 RepID=UPI003422D542
MASAIFLSVLASRATRLAIRVAAKEPSAAAAAAPAAADITCCQRGEGCRGSEGDQGPLDKLADDRLEHLLDHTALFGRFTKQLGRSLYVRGLGLEFRLQVDQFVHERVGRAVGPLVGEIRAVTALVG